MKAGAVNGEMPFKPGEIVQLSEAARQNSKQPARRGVVVGFSRTGNQVRIRWSGLMTSQLIHRRLLIPADGAE